MIKRNCKRCSKAFSVKPYLVRKGCGIFCSTKCANIVSRKNSIGKYRGVKSQNWKGDKLTYSGLHDWIKREYGKATKCENLDFCLGKSKTYDWALIKGKSYRRQKTNFLQLCRSCHVRYDKNWLKKKK